MGIRERLTKFGERPVLIARLSLALTFFSALVGVLAFSLLVFLDPKGNRSNETVDAVWSILGPLMCLLAAISLITSLVSAVWAVSRCAEKPWITLGVASLVASLGFLAVVWIVAFRMYYTA